MTAESAKSPAQLFEMHDKIAVLEMLARLMGLDARGARGRFAPPAESDSEAEHRAANAELRARLLRIARRSESTKE